MLIFVLLLCAEKPWQAGVAVRTITPESPMWMAGYAGRVKPAEGKEQDLFVKALAIEDPSGNRVVVNSYFLDHPPTLERGSMTAKKPELRRQRATWQPSSARPPTG